jgi:hypothetical protein
MPISAQSKLAARNGAAFISALKRWNETIDLLLDHRSVRAFSERQRAAVRVVLGFHT